jgi:hypothetical protein
VVYLESVAELIKRPRCELRVIFAPLDIPDRENATGHLAIFEHFQFPTGFLSERIQSVSHSFGSRKDEHGGQRKLKEAVGIQTTNFIHTFAYRSKAPGSTISAKISTWRETKRAN